MEVSNITVELTAQAETAINLALKQLLEKFMPIMKIIGGVVVLYIIYAIIKAISSSLMKKRIKRIDKNVEEIKQDIKEIKGKIQISKTKKEEKHKKSK